MRIVIEDLEPLTETSEVPSIVVADKPSALDNLIRGLLDKTAEITGARRCTILL